MLGIDQARLFRDRDAAFHSSDSTDDLRSASSLSVLLLASDRDGLGWRLGDNRGAENTSKSKTKFDCRQQPSKSSSKLLGTSWELDPESPPRFC